jgi:hypothetical protein
MSKIFLNSSEKKRFFIKEYYRGFKILRLFFWLVATVFFIYYTVFMYQRIPNISNLAPQIVIIGISIYFLFQPFFWFLLKRNQFSKNDRFEISLENESINFTLEDHSETSAVLLKNIKKIIERKDFFLLRFSNNSSVYLPKDQLTNTEKDKLNKFIM